MRMRSPRLAGGVIAAIIAFSGSLPAAAEFRLSAPCPLAPAAGSRAVATSQPTECLFADDHLRAALFPPDSGKPHPRVIVFEWDSAKNRPRATKALNLPASSPADAVPTFGRMDAKTWAWVRSQIGPDAPAQPPSAPTRTAERPEETPTQTQTVAVRYQYDHLGRLVYKVGNEGVRQYLYDGDSRRVLTELNEYGTVVASYSWSGDQLNSITRPGLGTFYPVTDGLGSMVALTDQAGEVVARFQYDAWGNIRSSSETVPGITSYRFTGHRWQEEIGLYNANARYYAPEVGRFTTQDTHLGNIEDPATLNLYTYVSNRPTRYVDPTGHYQADVHYGLTKALALKAGLSEQVAEAIARGAEAPDVPTDRRHPVESGKTVARPDWTFRSDESKRERADAERRLREWHFPMSPGEKRVVPNSAAARQRFDEAVKSGNPITIGESLHPFEDSWSHQGEPSLKGIAGHPGDRGGLTSTRADETAEFPGDAQSMARETYKLLVRVGEENPALREREPAKFREFKQALEEFIQADSKQEKREALEKLGTSMPKEYWDDVTLREKDPPAPPKPKLPRN